MRGDTPATSVAAAATEPGAIRPNDVIRVAVIADVRLHRDGVAALLRADGRIEVAATAAAGNAVGEIDVDVVVLDTASDDPLGVVRRWAKIGLPIVATGIPKTEDDVLAFAELGVLGFVERDAAIEELAHSIEAAARGEASCPPRVATTLLRRISASRAPPARTAVTTALTGREQQIVELIAQGMSNKEIGRKLFIEVATVKNHVHNILEKLQVSRRGEAVARLRPVDGLEPAHPLGLVQDSNSV